jgi:hypothetical protein
MSGYLSVTMAVEPTVGIRVWFQDEMFAALDIGDLTLFFRGDTFAEKRAQVQRVGDALADLADKIDAAIAIAELAPAEASA